MDIKKLSEPELKALALRKNAQGCATAAALKAQAILEEVCLIGGIIWLTTLIGKPC